MPTSPRLFIGLMLTSLRLFIRLMWVTPYSNKKCCTFRYSIFYFVLRMSQRNVTSLEAFVLSSRLLFSTLFMSR